MSLVIYAFKRLQYLYLHFKDFNVFSHLRCRSKLHDDEKLVKKISGIDENEKKQALIVEKFRSLLGLKSFHTKVPFNGDLEFLSPSPSPSPIIEETQAPAPSPSPLPHVHHHSHHPPHHKNPSLHQTHHEDRGRAKRILIAVLVSAGVAILIGACGLFLVWRRRRRRRKRRSGGRWRTHDL